MPMIDIVAPEGTFSESAEATLLDRATACILEWEKTGHIPVVVANTGAFLHVLPKQRLAAGGKSAHAVRVQILTPSGALTQEQRAGITAEVTAAVANLAVAEVTTWVLFREAVDGGWGVGGVAYTNAAIGDLVRTSLQR